MSYESLDPDSAARLDAALARTYVTQGQADEAARVYAGVLELGLHAKPVEEILFEKGMITATQADQLRAIQPGVPAAAQAAAAAPVSAGSAAAAPAATGAAAAPPLRPATPPTTTAAPRSTMRLSKPVEADASGTAGGTKMDMPVDAPVPGLPVDEVAGFRLVERVGAGSNGVVFKAIQVSMNRPVALKILSKRLARNSRFVERFLREARLAAKLNHPNVIGGIDVGEDRGLYYFAMEFADGRTVREMLERGGALDERQSLKIVLEIARGLDHAFKHGLIHRDIKPDNIIITQNRVAKLLDLGLARESGEDAAEAGKTFGTPNYISPEQARGDATIDTRSDIYSLGATLYHMLTGKTPFQGTPAIVMAKHISETPPDARTLNPSLSDATVEILGEMLSKDPLARHQSPQELIDHLEGVLERLDPAKSPATRPTATVRPRRRRRR